MKNEELLKLVEQWCIKNMPFEGKTKMVGVIADDLRLATFEYRQPHWHNGVRHNNEIGECLNILTKQGKLTINRSGRSHTITYTGVQYDI